MEQKTTRFNSELLGPDFRELAEAMTKLKTERGRPHPCLSCGRPTRTWKNLCWRDGKIGPACLSCRRLIPKDKKRSRWIKDIAKLGLEEHNRDLLD